MEFWGRNLVEMVFTDTLARRPDQALSGAPGAYRAPSGTCRRPRIREPGLLLLSYL